MMIEYVFHRSSCYGYLQRKKLEETENEWRSVIREAFLRNLGTLKSQCCASHSAITLYPYLKVLQVSII